MKDAKLKLTDFDYFLPSDRIAQAPAKPRDSAKLLVAGSNLSDLLVRDLPSILHPGDLLVVNDTKVIEAQLVGTQGNAKIGITLDQPQGDGTWHALARNARRVKPGDRLTFSPDLSAIILDKHAGGSFSLYFNQSEALHEALAQIGALALPPYIHRPNGPTAEDRTDYQTIFASAPGAVAAPTAGLHFTQPLIDALSRNHIQIARITLHVGAGTFLPVRTDDLASHQMHAERGTISVDTANQINSARARGSRIVAVGTTSLRLLESASRADGTILPFDGKTSLFIRPGYKFRAVDLLMTNFHLPKSTLFVLVCAFAGTERMRAAYDHAISHGYRFYSYGDSSLLERAPT